MATLLLIGAGGYGRAIAEVAQMVGGHRLVGFVDDRWPNLEPIWGLPIVGCLGNLPSLRSSADAVALAIGDSRARQRAFDQASAAGFELVRIVHPAAIVSPSAVLGRGLSVMAGAVIGTEARIDDGAIVNAGAVVDHHVHIGAFGHLGVGACAGGASVLEPHAWLRAGRALPPGHRLAAEQPGQGRAD